MKKTLLIAIPVGVLLLFGGIQAAHSFGFGARHFGVRRDFFEYRLDRLAEKLQLTTQQKAELDSLKKDIYGMADETLQQRQEFRKNLREELSKEELDPAAVTRMLDSQIDEQTRFKHQLVDKIGSFLSELTPEQRKELSDILMERFQRGMVD